jgi:hypothetical protein
MPIRQRGHHPNMSERQARRVEQRMGHESRTARERYGASTPCGYGPTGMLWA